MNNSYITIIKEKRTVLSRKRVPLNQNECTADFRIGVPFEQNLQNRDPEAYQRITEGVISFSRGWMALHNPENRRKVTGELSTMEFSIAMLASGGWTNKEIGEHLGISINTVKHYLTDIFCKLNVKKRDELKKFMLK